MQACATRDRGAGCGIARRRSDKRTHDERVNERTTAKVGPKPCLTSVSVVKTRIEPPATLRKVVSGESTPVCPLEKLAYICGIRLRAAQIMVLAFRLQHTSWFSISCYELRSWILNPCYPSFLKPLPTQHTMSRNSYSLGMLSMAPQLIPNTMRAWITDCVCGGGVSGKGELYLLGGGGGEPTRTAARVRRHLCERNSPLP